MPIDITVCKFTDDYDDSTPPIPYEGWEVYLWIDGVLYDTQYTETDGCYTWTDLEPGHSYAVEEDDPLAWFPDGPIYVDLGIILSGDYPNGYSHTWINLPAQSCTPGFWQGGPGGPDPQAGGARLWDGDPSDPGYPVYPDPDWVASGGANSNPYIHADNFHTYFGGYDPGAYTMFELVNTGGGSENWRKAARSLVAAYLNASWGVNYAYSTTELVQMWLDASNSADPDAAFLTLHTLLDAANNHFGNPDGDCPISAGGY